MVPSVCILCKSVSGAKRGHGAESGLPCPHHLRRLPRALHAPGGAAHPKSSPARISSVSTAVREGAAVFSGEDESRVRCGLLSSYPMPEVPGKSHRVWSHACRCPVCLEPQPVGRPEGLPDSDCVLALLGVEHGQAPPGAAAGGGRGAMEGGAAGGDARVAGMCPLHPNEPIRGFCAAETCMRAVCVECDMFEHRNAPQGPHK
jgi:hypothetical protein